MLYGLEQDGDVKGTHWRTQEKQVHENRHPVSTAPKPLAPTE